MAILVKLAPAASAEPPELIEPPNHRVRSSDSLLS
jgi:hypothetical protein